MAMMISKFHRLIQNKLTWWIIIGVIVVTFVFWGSQTGQQNTAAREASAMATLKGVPVDRDEFTKAFASTHLSVMLQSGRQIDVNQEVEKLLRKQAWQRIGMLREAASFGIVADDSELLTYLHSAYSVFRTPQGQFNGDGYRQFAQQVLPRLGFSQSMFDDFIREEIIIQKMGGLLVRTMLVTPSEARRMYHSMNDTFQAQYAFITPKDVEGTIKVGEAEARALFDKDPKAYTIPEMAVVSYVEFVYSNYLAVAEVADADVTKYYNDNLDDFIIPSTNAASTNEFTTEAVKYKTQDEAKPQIVTELKKLSAARIAASNALAFAARIQGTIDAAPQTFTAAAAAAGLKILETRPFAENDDVPGLDVPPMFNRVAFSLVADEGGNVGDPVEAPNAIYIMAYKSRAEARVPSFAEAASNVMADARSMAVRDAASMLAKKTRDAMESAAKNGQSIGAAVKALGVTVTNTPLFSATTGEELEIPHFSELIRTVLTLNAGEVAEPVPTFGGILIVHLAQRVSADLTVFEQNRPMLSQRIRQSQARNLFESWQEYLLKRDEFVDLFKKATEEDVAADAKS